MKLPTPFPICVYLRPSAVKINNKKPFLIEWHVPPPSINLLQRTNNQFQIRKQKKLNEIYVFCEPQMNADRGGSGKWYVRLWRDDQVTTPLRSFQGASWGLAPSAFICVNPRLK
jgi:hypothetical protein